MFPVCSPQIAQREEKVRLGYATARVSTRRTTLALKEEVCNLLDEQEHGEEEQFYR